MRKEIFALSELWFKNQTIHKNPKYKISWLCVDDYPADPTKFTCGQTVIKAPVEWSPGINTQQSNMEVLLEQAKGDILINWEDDDYYSPEYIETMLKLLETSDIAGLSCAKYYHINAQGYLILQNYKHSSLSQTAIKKSLFKRFYRAVQSGNVYMDISLWNSCRKDGVFMSLLANTNLSIGIKGMPVGKAGISNGHNPDNYQPDPQLNVLKGWLGKDYKHYLPFCKISIDVNNLVTYRTKL